MFLFVEKRKTDVCIAEICHSIYSQAAFALFFRQNFTGPGKQNKVCLIISLKLICAKTHLYKDTSMSWWILLDVDQYHVHVLKERFLLHQLFYY